MKHFLLVLAFNLGACILFPLGLMAQGTPLSATELKPLRLDDDPNAQSGAQMIFSNPAGLGFNEKYQFAYDFWGNSQGSQAQRHAISMSYQFFKAYHVALGWQQGSFFFANALRFNQFSLGFSYQTASEFWNETQQNLNQSFKLGFQYRVSRYLSLGVSEWISRTPFEDLKVFTELGLAVKPFVDRAYLSTSFRTESNHNASLLSSIYWRLTGGDFFLGSISLYARHQYQIKSEEQTLAFGLSFNGGLGILGGFQAPMNELSNEDQQLYYAGVRLKAKKAEEEREQNQPKIVEINLTQVAELQKKSVMLINSELRSPYLDKLLTLKKLENETSVSAIVLTIAGENYDWGRAWELGQQINALKKAGKRIYAFVLSANTQSYFVASHADEIWTPPVFELMLTSIGGQWVYFGDFLRNIGVQPQFLAVGDYKNAPEMFVKNGPSPYAKEVSQNLLDQKYQILVDTISTNRKLGIDETKSLIAQGPFVSNIAKSKKLIDGIAFYDEFLRMLEKKHKNHRFEQRYEQGQYQSERWGDKDQIAVIHAVGELGGNGLLGGQDRFFNPETLIPLIEKLKYQKQVKAVVLRIDSPGGDVNGADHIWRYLTMLAKRKPLIVSMGDVAASGGYYVAAPAHKIFASPLTITGSIGIFAGKFSVANLLKKFGIEVFSLEKDPNAHTMSLLTPWSEALEKQFTTSLTELYELFLNRVLSGRNGRKLNPKNKFNEKIQADQSIVQAQGNQGVVQAQGDQSVVQAQGNQSVVQAQGNQGVVQAQGNQGVVQAQGNQGVVQAQGNQDIFNRAHLLRIASGRVWTGNEAYAHGLVDQIGGLSDAIEEAAKIAKLKDYEVRGYYGEAQSTIKKALGQAQGLNEKSEESLNSNVVSESNMGESLINDLSHHFDFTDSQAEQIDQQSTALLLQSISSQASSHSTQFLQAFTQLYQLLLLSLTPQAAQQLMSIFSAISFGTSTKVMAILPWLELNSSTME